MISAVKRGKAEPLLDDVAICVQLGWTHDMLMRQPARFVERVAIYLEALGDRVEREQRRLEDELRRRRR
jgi:hypothetical protein